MPALIEVLTDADMLLRKMAVVALGAIGSNASSAVTGLTEVLIQDEKALVRGFAAVSLGQIGAQEAMPALEQASEGEGSYRWQPIPRLLPRGSHRHHETLFRPTVFSTASMASLAVPTPSSLRTRRPISTAGCA